MILMGKNAERNKNGTTDDFSDLRRMIQGMDDNLKKNGEWFSTVVW